MSTIKDLLKSLNKKYDFIYNEVTTKMYFREKNKSEYTLLDDGKLNSLYVEFKKKFERLSISDFYSTIHSDQVFNRINPIQEYFRNLPEWDGKDYLGELSKTIKTKRPHHWKKFFKKWLVGVVGCAIDENVINHLTLILIGKQGVGKTTWLNNLVPPELKEHLYIGTIDSSKDSQIHLSECMFINIDEFETIGRKGLNQLKSIITQQSVRIRRPYGRISEYLPRRASFMASVNDHNFLVDTTGNRRFLVFETKEINFQHNINLKMVYSQCLHLYREKFKFFLTQKEVELVSRINERYVIKTYEEELLLQYFTPTLKGNGEILTTTQILERISKKSNTHINNTSIYSLGRALGKNGFVKGKTKNNRHGWWVQEIDYKPVRKSDFED